jgi:UDP-N-acetylmuramate dehydrogenase
MNAGAYGGEIKDVLINCIHLNNELVFETVKKDFLGLEYRGSIYSNNKYIITSLSIQLNLGEKNKIKQKMNEIMSSRKNKQPLEYPSAGSVFKRPKDNYAGLLIEECGLKGKRIGDAEVSEKHAGFIVNKGNATSNDVLKLIDFIQETIFHEKGIMLETEIKCI